jgi:hypothetical protein
VPPHDTTIEAHLLGAALITEQAAQVVAALDPTTFYKPAHTRIAATIGDLVNRGWPTDVGTVGAHLHQDGHLDDIGGYVYLTEMMADTPATRSAEHWATLIDEYAAKRRLLALSAETVEAVYRGIPTNGLIEAMHQTALEVDQAITSSWEQVNLARILAGEGPDTTPTILRRTDGPALIYPGKVHAVNAEPEAGKSWLCVHACHQQLDAGRHVIYVDFEADAADITNRLLALGAAPTQILEQFHYIRPLEPVSAAATGRLVGLAQTTEAALVVIDGVTEAMATAGMSINDNDDIARFYALLPRPAAGTGAAVVLIDHVTKDRETQGRWGIGGQHKLAGIDGASYKLEAISPFAKNKPGSSRLIVSKDRHGQVRTYATPGAVQTVATVRFDTAGGGMAIRVEPPGQRSQEPFLPTRQMQRVSQALAASPTRTLSKRGIRAAVHGDNNVIDLAVEHLIGGGYARKVTGGVEHIRAYLAPDEPSAGPTTESAGHDYMEDDNSAF